MLKAAQLVQNHLAGILAHWKWGLTNAFMEGLNSVFSAVKRKARGYRSTVYLITMLYLVAGKLRLPHSSYHLPVSENLTRFLQAPLATPGFPEPPFWPPFWRGLGGRGGPGGPGLAAPVLSAPIWLDVLPGLAGAAAHGRPGHSLSGRGA